MIDWKDVHSNEERHRQLLEQSFQRALLDMDKRPAPRRIQRIYGPALARLGSLLLDWGASLQDRYAHRPNEQLNRRLERILARNVQHS